MSEQPIVHYVGKRQPPLFGTLSTDSSTDPLPAGATVTFSMRLVNSSTLKVNAASAVVVDEPNNLVRYDWAAADVDTAGTYVGWWTVTISGQSEDTPEFLIVIQQHAPVSPQYISVEEMKQSLGLGGENYADQDIERAIKAASKAVDSLCDPTYSGSSGYFTSVTETRTFTATGDWYLYTGPISTVTAVSNNGTAWTQGTEYFIDGGDTLRTLSLNAFSLAGNAISVTGTFGYATIPPEVVEATQIIAAQLLRRVREAPFGVLASALDGPAIRIGRFDPQVDLLLAAHTRSLMVQ